MKSVSKKSSFTWLAGAALACAVGLTSCSSGTDTADTNVEQSSNKNFTNPSAANETAPDTASAHDHQPGMEHYEQTYGGAKEEPTNPNINSSTPQQQPQTQNAGRQQQ